MEFDLEPIPDRELEQLAVQGGPDSLEAQTFNALQRERGLDKQVYAFRIGPYYMVGPSPDAKIKFATMLAYAYIKHLRS